MNEEEVQEVLEKDSKLHEVFTKEGAFTEQKIKNMVGGVVGLLVGFGIGLVASKTSISHK